MPQTKKYKGRVIVTYGRSIISLMIAQSLGSRGIEVIGGDSVGLTVLSFSKYITKNVIFASPTKDEAQFIEDLETIVRENKPKDERPYILIPAFNDAKIIAQHKERFKDLITIACPNFESINKIDPKDHLALTAKDLNVASPQTWLPKDQKDLKQTMKDINYPVFIKPPDDVGGRGISKIESPEDLTKAYDDLLKRYPGEQIVIQSASNGEDYCFCGLFDNGTLKASMVYKNIQTYPNETGPGVVRETVDDKIFNDIAEQLMKPINWNGVAEIDFMWDGSQKNTPVIIEVNPRFWAGLDHSIKSNIDFPFLLFCLFAYGSVENDTDAKIGHKTSLPGLSAMARIEKLFSSAINFDDLATHWPKIKDHLKDSEYKKAALLLKDNISESFNFDEAYKLFKTMKTQAKNSESIAYSDDDPFVGLGMLFILAYLAKNGELPPEITS